MQPQPQFNKKVQKPTLKPDYLHQERAAIHEFDGQLPRPEAEARAAEECQHCGQAAPLQPVYNERYCHGLDVCEACVENLMAGGWIRGGEPQAERLF